MRFLVGLYPACIYPDADTIGVSDTDDAAARHESMPGTDKMSELVTKMSEMCMAMMEKEKAMMPLIIGMLAIFGLLLFVALLLLVVLEIQWIKYWSRILRQGQPPSP